MATVQDIREEIKSDLVITSSDYDAQIESKIRAALRQHATKRYWFLRDSTTLTLAAGDFYVSLPANFSVPSQFEAYTGGQWRGDGNGFDLLSYDRLRNEYWTTDPLKTGQPSACAVEATRLYVSCLADVATNIRCVYFKKDETPPTSTQTSVWFDDGYDLIRSTAMFLFKKEAGGYTDTEEMGRMMAYYEDQLNQDHQNFSVGRY